MAAAVTRALDGSAEVTVAIARPSLRQRRKPQQFPAFPPLDHVREAVESVYQSFGPEVSPNKDCVVFKLPVVLEKVLRIHPPKQEVTAIKVTFGARVGIIAGLPCLFSYAAKSTAESCWGATVIDREQCCV